ncbi:MAG TPA: T9SS type A sorting domain-containing protein [Bacteroidia bacterium]|nr:T9SS type A sorting domain-containing protein [Bacteroidia bacterium]
MNPRLIIALLLLLTSATAKSQSPAVWTVIYSGELQLPSGLLVDRTGQWLNVWGRGSDTACGLTAPAIIKLDSAGLVLGDTLLDINYCADELPLTSLHSRNAGGIYLASRNNVITPEDSNYIYYVDDYLNIQWSLYAGEAMPPNILHYYGAYYFSSDSSSGVMVVKRFNAGGGVSILNPVTLPYFLSAPYTLLAEDGFIFEFGTRMGIVDTAFICQVYDTSGNYFTTFSFDADNTIDETMMHASISSNQIFHVSYRPSIARTYPAASGITGIVNWVDTIYHSYRGACSDTINNVGYVLCTSGPSIFEIFSYDLFTGTLIDSVEVDSSIALTNIKSGPAGGVYFMYTKAFIGEITLDQYDKNLDLLWRGIATHPTCTSQCSPRDFVIDSMGYVYTVSNCSSCPDNILVSKYAPSLVGIEDPVSEVNYISIFPSPAQDNVTITLNDAEGSNNTANIYNSSGQVIHSSVFSGSSSVFETSQFAPGIYFIEVTTETGQRFISKLIIQHSE